MTDLILFMVMDEKSKKIQIIHSIKDFFGLAVITDDNIKLQAIGFHGNFIGD